MNECIFDCFSGKVLVKRTGDFLETCLLVVCLALIIPTCTVFCLTVVFRGPKNASIICRILIHIDVDPGNTKTI